LRALTISEHGGLDRVEFRDDVAIPELRTSTDVQIRVAAAALNHLDLLAVGGLKGVTIAPPWILGADGTGVADAVGSAVSTIGVGDRVLINGGISCRACEYCRAGDQPLCPRFGMLGEHRPGTFAEVIVLPAENVRRVPGRRTDRSDAQAAAHTLVTLMAWRMLGGRARVQAGESVLAQGIGGGVAIASLLIAKLLGALGRRGWLVTRGGTTGATVEIDVRRMFWNQRTLMGSTMGSDPEFDAIVAELAAGRLAMPVDSVFPLEPGREALERMAAGRHFGKIVRSIAS
jgi:NADPH:quinone reductase-like Zn-dependent oxidoreductase